MPEIEDKSLLKCTIKKSVDVLKKVVLYGLYSAVTIILITAIAAVGYLIWLGFNSSLATIIYSSIISLLVSIPWYVYVGVIALLAIPVYSLVWCIARELQDEDWKSDAATTFAFAFALAAFALSAVAAFAFALAVFAFFALPAVAAFALSALAAFALSAPATDVDSKVFLLPGAYMNYRKRMKVIKEGEP